MQQHENLGQKINKMPRFIRRKHWTKTITFSTKFKTVHQQAEMISKQGGPQIKIFAHDFDNGKTSNFCTTNTAVQLEIGNNLSRDEPIKPPPTL